MDYIPLLYSVIFALIAVAILLISGFGSFIIMEHRHRVIKRRKANAMKLRKQTLFTKLARLEQKRRRVLSQVKIPKMVYYLLTGIGAIGGAAIGKMFFSETLFAIVVGILGAFSPQLYLSLKQTLYTSSRIEKLQSSMMILSNSYIVTEDFLKTVQDNIDVIEYPAPFRNFLTYVSLIDSNIKTGLRRMENQVDNIYFSQWIDVLIMAQDDRSLKFVTMSVVDAMNDVHQAQRESDTSMYAIWREYFTVLILIFSAPVIFRILMRPAYLILVTTLPGKVLLLLLLSAVVFSLIKAVQLNKPLLM